MNRIYLAPLVFLLISACNEKEKDSSGKYILLGDPNTIVTETDSQYLKNNFDDLSIKTNTTTIPVDTAPKQDSNLVSNITETKSDSVSKTETTSNSIPTQTVQNSISGYEIKLSNSTLVLNDMSDKQVRKSSNISYVVNPKNYPKTVSSKSGEGTIKYRTVAVVYFVKDGQRIRLSSLGENRSDWSSVSSKNSVFQMPNLNLNPSFKKVSSAEIQKAVQNGITALKISQKEKNKLASDLKKITSLQHSSIQIVLEKVEWDILINNKSDKLYFTF